MGLIEGCVLAVFGLLVTIFIPVAARLITDDIKEWLPWIKNRLIERAVRKLPESERERYAEEWRSYVNETPGDLSKIVAALGFGFAATSIAYTTDFVRSFSPSRRALEIIFSGGYTVFALGVLILLAFYSKFSSGSVFTSDYRLKSNGQSYRVWRFRMRDDTVVGRYLSALGLDELPCVINIAAGDVAVVRWLPLKLRFRGVPLPRTTSTSLAPD